MTIGTITRLAWGIALANAYRLSRRSPRFRPVLRVLGAGLVLDVGRVGLNVAILKDAPRPFVGLARAVYHLDQGAVLAFPALSVVLALVAFERTSPRLALVAAGAVWFQALLDAIAGYPLIRGDAFLDVCLRAQALAVVVEVLAAWRVLAASVRRPRLAFEVMPLQQRAALVLLAADAAQLVGPWLGAPVAHWSIWRVQSLLALGTLAVLEEKWIRSRSRS